MIRLDCQGCGASVVLHPTFRLSRLGSVRLYASTDWYVDGGAVVCPKCITGEQSTRLHSETWQERFDREARDRLYELGELK